MKAESMVGVVVNHLPPTNVSDRRVLFFVSTNTALYVAQLYLSRLCRWFTDITYTTCDGWHSIERMCHPSHRSPLFLRFHFLLWVDTTWGFLSLAMEIFRVSCRKCQYNFVGFSLQYLSNIRQVAVLPFHPFRCSCGSPTARGIYFTRAGWWPIAHCSVLRAGKRHFLLLSISGNHAAVEPVLRMCYTGYMKLSEDRKDALSNLFIALLSVHYGAIWLRIILFPNSDLLYVLVNAGCVVILGWLVFTISK